MAYADAIKFVESQFVNIIYLTIASALAIFLYYKSIPRAKLRFHKKEVSLIGNKASSLHEDLTIFFNDQKVPRVTVTQIVLWNKGNTTIDGSQIVETDALRVCLKTPDRLLKTTVLRETRSQNGLRVSSIDSTQALIEFSFLDPNDGFTIEIAHTGRPGDIDLQGTIKGMPSGLTPDQKDNLTEIISDKLGIRTSIAKAIIISLFGASLITGLTLYEMSLTAGQIQAEGISNNPPALEVLVMIISGLAGLAAGFWSNPQKRISYPRSLHTDLGGN